MGSGPRGIVRSGDDVWVTNELSASVTRIDVDTRRPHPVDVGDGPTDLAVLGDDVWVAEKYSGASSGSTAGPPTSSGSTSAPPSTGSRSPTAASGWSRERSPPRAISGVTCASRWPATPPSTGSTGRRSTRPACYDTFSSQASRIVYDGLVALNYSGADPQVLVPDLADSVPTPTDGDRTYIFNLRPGIRYSDGTEVRASDFVLGLQRALRVSPRPDFYAGLIRDRACLEEPTTTCELRAGAVVADDAAGRVTFHLDAPDPLFLYKLTLFVVPTPPGTPVGPLTSPPLGTGAIPDRLAGSWHGPDPDRNPWFQQWSIPAQPAGFPDTITWRTLPTAAEAVEAVEQGRADLADVTMAGNMDTPSHRQLVERLRVTTPGRLHGNSLMGTAFLALNASRPPFDNLQARRALNFALDRTKAIELGVGPSLAQVTCQLMPPSMPSYGQLLSLHSGPSGRYLRRPRPRPGARSGPGVRDRGHRGRGRRHRRQRRGLAPYVVDVLRSLGYRATIRWFPDTPSADGGPMFDPASGVEVANTAFFRRLSRALDLLRRHRLHAEQRVGAARLLRPARWTVGPPPRRRCSGPSQGSALRAWTEIDHDVTDQAPLVALANPVRWWLTSERVGNYQNGDITPGPLLSQLWVQ